MSNTVPAHVFREYDIRGVADRDLSDALAEGIGRGLGTMLAKDGKPPRLAVGRDCRLSSQRLFDALCRGLVATGVHVVEIGVGPTPMLYFAVYHLETDGGIQITGSHNPGDENGFKIVLLTRLSPLFPFNVLNYAYGASPVAFRDYLVASWIGMLPATILYVYLGSAIASLADLAAGRVEGGLAQKLLFGLGLAATAAVTVLVTRIARRALSQAVPTADAL